MKKKKIMMAAMSAGLVAVVGVGGTLAYLSSTSNEVKNTFTVGKGFETDDNGHQGIFLDEIEYQYNEATNTNVMTGKRTEKGVEYKNLMPGDSYIKDPTVHLVGGSVASYVFVKVEGVDALEDIKNSDNELIFDISDWNTNAWTKLTSDGEIDTDKEGDGYYVYSGRRAIDNIVDVSTMPEKSDQLLDEALFETIKLNDVNQLPDELSEDVVAGTVKVNACAVQASNVSESYTEAFEQAKNILDDAK